MTDRTAPLFILAGGLGKRLRAITRDRWPKPMVPIEVAGTQHPFLEFVLARFAAVGVRDAVICTGHLGAQIPAYFGDGAAFGLHLQYDDAQDLDTGARLHHALQRFPSERILVSCGDVYLDADLAVLTETLDEHPEWDAVLALVAPGEAAANVALAASGQVTGYGDGAEDAKCLEAGCFALRPGAFGHADVGPDLSLAHDLLPRLAKAGRLGGVRIDGRFFDIGTPEGYRHFADFAGQGGAMTLGGNAGLREVVES
jgi:NDP-sugar pyrophosphorylase family protein